MWGCTALHVLGYSDPLLLDNCRIVAYPYPVRLSDYWRSKPGDG